MSELNERIAAEEARINAATKERLLIAQRQLEAEIKWVTFDAANESILKHAQIVNRIFWGMLIAILGSGLVWAIFGKL